MNTINAPVTLLQPLGYQIVGILGILMLAREIFLVIQGQPANFVKVITRVLWATLFIKIVPSLADGISTGIQNQSSDLLSQHYTSMMDSVRTIYANHGNCPDADESWFTAMSQLWIFDMSVIISLLMALVALLLLIVKIAIIDIAWHIQLSVIVVAAPIVIAMGTLEEFGGFAHFWRTILSVLVWPLMFAILIVASSAIVQDDFASVRSQSRSLFCSIDMATENGLSMESAQAAVLDRIKAKTVQTATSFRVIATMLVLLVLTLKVPSFCSSLFGAGSAGAFGGAAMGAMVGAAGSTLGGGLRGVATAAGGGGAVRAAAAVFNVDRFVRGGGSPSTGSAPSAASAAASPAQGLAQRPASSANGENKQA